MRIGGKGLNDLKLGTFVGRLPSDGAASIAVKGLMSFALRFCNDITVIVDLALKISYVSMFFGLTVI